ncbi:MAG TPA: hypothetical protein VLJ58_10380 [Ramlibacter sp.]|nr:hypothetical protein [Ramlibacter sp.]
MGSYEAWQLWLALEANPRVISFCERPALLDADHRITIDFWVQLTAPPASEFWLLERSEDAAAELEESHIIAGDKPALASRAHGLPLRQIPRAQLGAWSVPVTNWSRIVPYLVTGRRFPNPLLEQSIVVFLGRPCSFDEVLARFNDHDDVAVESALFSLVARGRVVSPDLATSLLSGATRFRRA